jgi:hypothetical protein
LFPAPVSEEAGEADADEPVRQHVQHKAAQELLSRHRHFALLATVGVILPPEADPPIGNGQQPMIGDDNAVRCSARLLPP